MSSAGGVPTIDLAGDPEEVARLLKEACENVGFFMVVNHDVPDDLLSRVMLVTRGFFELPEDEKMRVGSLKKGYIPVGGCDNAVRPTSLHEKYSCGRVDGVDKTDAYYDPTGPHAEQAALYFGEDNRWPARPTDFQPTWTAYYKAMEALTERIMTLFAMALGVRPDFFKDKIDKHVTNLVALRYPPLTTSIVAPAKAEAGAEVGAGPPPPPPAAGGEDDDVFCTERVKPHTDPTDITILAFERGPEGLQVLPDGVEDWIDVPRVPGSLLVNLGDVLRFWTNDTWRSTRHRVIVRRRRRRRGVGEDSSEGGDDGEEDRMSLVFFHMPNYDTVIDCADFFGDAVDGHHGPDRRPRKYPAFKSGERSHFAQLVRNEKGLPDRQTLKMDNSRGDL